MPTSSTWIISIPPFACVRHGSEATCVELEECPRQANPTHLVVDAEGVLVPRAGGARAPPVLLMRAAHLSMCVGMGMCPSVGSLWYDGVSGHTTHTCMVGDGRARPADALNQHFHPVVRVPFQSKHEHALTSFGAYGSKRRSPKDRRRFCSSFFEQRPSAPPKRRLCRMGGG